mmetsp:Transcript_143889/g.460603  ORF Transcript_143889/g.460603 Transcript_143889/m.460603 type:complete len:271 (-) Transcript_143889:72-884(-)
MMDVGPDGGVRGREDGPYAHPARGRVLRRRHCADLEHYVRDAPDVHRLVDLFREVHGVGRKGAQGSARRGLEAQDVVRPLRRHQEELLRTSVRTWELVQIKLVLVHVERRGQPRRGHLPEGCHPLEEHLVAFELRIGQHKVGRDNLVLLRMAISVGSRATALADALSAGTLSSTICIARLGGARPAGVREALRSVHRDATRSLWCPERAGLGPQLQRAQRASPLRGGATLVVGAQGGGRAVRNGGVGAHGERSEEQHENRSQGEQRHRSD